MHSGSQLIPGLLHFLDLEGIGVDFFLHPPHLQLLLLDLAHIALGVVIV